MREKEPTLPSGKETMEPENIELIEAAAAKEKMDARAEILERHGVVFFSCIPEGSFDGVLAKIPEETRSEKDIPLSEHELVLKALGWKSKEEQKRLKVVNAISQKDYPATEEVSGIIIGGSPHMLSTDREEWIDKLEDYVRNAAAKKIPVLGICFGHQLVAKAFGGNIEKTSRREFGTVDIDLTEEGANDALFRDLPQEMPALMSHSESVTKTPEIIRSLAFNEHNINQAIGIGENVRGVQFHPEMVKEVLEIVSVLREDAMKQEGLDVEKIRRTLRDTPEAQRVLKNFEKYFVFKYHLREK